MPLASGQRYALDRLFHDPAFGNAFWGVRVETMEGEVLYDLNGARNFMPASNMKIYSTAAALALLGTNFRYETPFLATGPINAGVLEGDLVLVGSGDPTIGYWDKTREVFATEVFDRWVEALRGAGLRGVRGAAVGDGRCFGPTFFNGGWEWEDLTDSDGAGSSGLAACENAVRIAITPGAHPGDRASISMQPDTRYTRPINRVVTVPQGEAANERFLQISDPMLNQRIFAGRITAGTEPRINRVSVYDGAGYTATLLAEALERGGIAVGQGGRSIDPEESVPEGATVLYTHLSPPLSEIVTLCNKPSNNFIADHLLRTVGLHESGEGSYEAGARAVKKWLLGLGLPDLDSFSMVDGSGLARRDIVQPRHTCAILRTLFLQGGPVWDSFHESLPISGETEDISVNFPKLPRRRVHAKTGLIPMVRALSGTVTRDSGEMLLFSMMANHYAISWREVDGYIENALVELMK